MKQRDELAILFVDDESDILHSLNRFLRREEYRKFFVDNAVEALELLAKTPVDLVVSDLRMPGMNGLDLIKEVKRLYPGTLRMIVSGSQDIEQIIESVNKGEIFRFIPKPVEPESFKNILNDALDYYCMKLEREELFDEISLKNGQLTDANATLEKLAGDLKRSEAQFRSMNDAAQDAVFMLDGSGLVRYRNTAAEVMFGYRRSEHPAQPVSEIFPETSTALELNDLVSCDSALLARSCANLVIQIEGLRKDGSRLPLEISRGCVHLESGPHSVLIARDISTRIEEEKSRKQYETMQKELESQIEKKLLQSQAPITLRHIEISYLMHSSGHLDGDFTELIEYDPLRADLLIGDVMGHGIQSALVSAGLKSLFLKSIAEERKSPEALPPLERIVGKIHERCIHELIDLGMFATLLFVRLDLKNRQASFVDCGHNPLIHLPAKTGRCRLVKGGNLPMGMIEKEEYRQAEFAVDENDLLVLYSDGITENRSPGDELFGIERFSALLEEHAALPTEAIVEKIEAALMEFCGCTNFEDDVTCIVIRISGSTKMPDNG
ncbi:response regulator [Chlorobaculum thiosulfatiphilum]|uniref:Response regulator n=1 Tax=Chlorobaculum thiosulfatiphilum TaxID=115852 RepID=A0A5C4S6Z6_CHLTI|nr:SpoIIE family protein phosphatase [Chlorobaculum thiosulfatiphilum]TNJ39300.1 response regulator [Chlorobaculum thiosulfatiphilum]